jgi:predicted HicB family RNase H-like nuclease
MLISVAAGEAAISAVQACAARFGHRPVISHYDHRDFSETHLKHEYLAITLNVRFYLEKQQDDGSPARVVVERKFFLKQDIMWHGYAHVQMVDRLTRRYWHTRRFTCHNQQVK